MVRKRPRRTAARGVPHGVQLTPSMVEEMRSELPSLGDHIVTAIIEEVPSYTNALGGPMGETIRNAVKIALGAFLSLASAPDTDLSDLGVPAASALEGAYQLGRGEARSGRTTDALLSAYRIGARIAWRELSRAAVAGGMDGEDLAAFAELVFAYIDELSAASVAGHNDELETAGREHQRQLERIGRLLLERAPAEKVQVLADEAGWTPPRTLTAVLVPESQVRPLLGAVPAATLHVGELPGLSDVALLMVPDAHGRGRAGLLRAAEGRGAIAGPPRPWLDVRASYDRAVRARTLGVEVDTEAHLPELVLTADPDALADLRAQALAPLADLRPSTAEKLAETLRAWLLHQGRRDEVAEALYVHPQTVRYRMGQLRELYGDRLEDPETVLALTLALATRR